MNTWITLATFFAEGDGGAPEGEGGPAIPQIWMLVAMAAMAYFILFLPNKREKAKRKSLLDTLKKNDKVVTSGGILGTIASVSPDSNEVTLKVDDNTRIRLMRSSIQQIIEPPGDAEKES